MLLMNMSTFWNKYDSLYGSTYSRLSRFFSPDLFTRADSRLCVDYCESLRTGRSNVSSLYALGEAWANSSLGIFVLPGITAWRFFTRRDLLRP